jgi:hypothetical protein
MPACGKIDRLMRTRSECLLPTHSASHQTSAEFCANFSPLRLDFFHTGSGSVVARSILIFCPLVGPLSVGRVIPI